MSWLITSKRKRTNGVCMAMSWPIAVVFTLLVIESRELVGMPLCFTSISRNQPSSSCWNPPRIKSRGGSSIEISETTLEQMIDIKKDWIPDNSPLHIILLEMHEEIAGALWEEGLGFFYDYQPNVTDNSDCRIYFRPRIGFIDRSRPWRKPIGKSPCNEAAWDLALLFTEASRRFSFNEAGPLQKYYYSIPSYPDKNVAGQYAETKIAGWVLFAAYYNLKAPMEKRGVEIAIAAIPVTSMTTRKETSLRNIAEGRTGNPENWSAMWALNMDSIFDPRSVPKGVRLKVPAKIIDWKKVDVDPNASWDIADDTYGNKEYGSFVANFMLDALNRKDEQAFIPIYAPEEKIEPRYVIWGRIATEVK